MRLSSAIAFACAQLLLCAALLPAAALASNGMRDIAPTAQDAGRGGAFIAVEPSAAAVAGNPASLGMLCWPELYTDVRLLIPELSYRGRMNARGRSEYYLAPTLAYAQPWGGRMAWGVGVVSASVMGFTYQGFDLSLLGAPSGTTDRAGSKVRYLTASGALAWRFSERSSAGMAVDMITGETADQSYDFFGNTTGHSLSGLSGRGYGLRAGLVHRIDPDTLIGAYWRSRTHLKASDGTLTFGPMSQTPGAVVHDVSVVGGNFPEEYGAGLSHSFSEQWRGFMDWRHTAWSRVKGTVSIVPPQGQPIEFAMDWRDQDAFSLGAEYYPHCEGAETWRWGMNYARSPVPDSTLSPMFPAIGELHLTMGYERPLSQRVRLTSSVVYGARHSQTSTPGSMYAQPFGAGESFSVAQQSWQFGLGLTWRLGSRGSKPGACDTCGGRNGAIRSGRGDADACTTCTPPWAQDANPDDPASAVKAGV